MSRARSPQIPPEAAGLLQAMHGCSERDELPLREWMQSGHRALLRALIQWCECEELGEELAHRVLIVAFQSEGEWDAVRNERAWIARVAVLERFNCLRERRQKAQPLSEPCPEDSVPARSDPARRAQLEEVRDAVTRALERLPKRFGGILRARYLEGLSEAACAERLKRTEGVGRHATRRRLRLGRERLRVLLSASEAVQGAIS